MTISPIADDEKKVALADDQGFDSDSSGECTSSMKSSRNNNTQPNELTATNKALVNSDSASNSNDSSQVEPVHEL